MCPEKVIAVDLDGTLIHTDTLHESIVGLVHKKPLYLFLMMTWLAKGRAMLKAKIASHFDLDVKMLPYNQPLIDWLKEKRSDGKKIILCSAANKNIANAVADHLQLFDEVIASDATTNLKSANKRIVLEKKFGKKGYDYVGNSNADIKVWAGASHAIVVNASRTVYKKATQVTTVSKTFSSKALTITDWFRAFRIHQWLKNLLLFVPLLAAHQADNIQSLLTLFFAFISFSMCASAVYMTNDLLDLESDRSHPRKRDRPFAAGTLPITAGALLVPLFIMISLLLGLVVGSAFLVWLILYLALTSIYSLSLKRIALIDCLMLAALFTIRVIAGAAAVSVQLSFWLLAFSMFIFLSLAFVKRYAELQVQLQEGNSHAHGRGYVVSDAPLLQILGVTGGYAAVLVLALYLHSETVTALYIQPMLIWFALPLLFFWISWVWIKARRGQMHDDPIVFAIKDKVSLVVAVLMAAAFVLAKKGIGT